MAKTRIVVEVDSDAETAFGHVAWAIYNQNTERLSYGGEVITYSIVAATPMGEVNDSR